MIEAGEMARTKQDVMACVSWATVPSGITMGDFGFKGVTVSA